MKLKQMALLILSIMFVTACFTDSDSDSKGSGNASCDGVAQPALEANEEFATDFSQVAGNYELTFSESTSGSGFTDGEVLAFEVTADGALAVGDTMVLCHPVLYLGNDQEAIWKADEDGLRFAVSSLVNGFNEINVSNEYHYDATPAGTFVFYGQFSNK